FLFFPFYVRPIRDPHRPPTTGKSGALITWQVQKERHIILQFSHYHYQKQTFQGRLDYWTSINGLAASSTAQFPVRALGRRSKDMAAILLADLQKDVDELDEDEEEEQGLLADVHLPDPIRPHDAPVSAAKARFDVEKSKKELCMAALAFFDDLHAMTTGKSEPIRDLVHYARVEDSVTQTLYDKFFIPAYMCLGTISMLIGGSRNVLSYPNDRNGYDDTLDVPRCTTQERWKQLEGLLTKSYSGYAAFLMQVTRKKEKKKNVTFELDCMARSMRQY
ncbi:hypothetical protein A4X03_0g9137, partial [Tilletia caries]